MHTTHTPEKHDEAELNARLIAAAPEMLDLLIAIQRVGLTGTPWETRLNDVIVQAGGQSDGNQRREPA